MSHFNLPSITPVVCDGIVFYCDGSAKPNPGFIGCGLHGYSYKKEEPKKGTGLGTHMLTTIGYVDNKEAKDSFKPITPINYYNVVGSFNFQSTNNVAELLAINIAIEIALATNTKKLLIKTDSDYSVKVLTKMAAHWVKNNWTKRDGTPVSNQEFIKNILKGISLLQEREIAFDIQWVKGHSTYLGNNAADRLANIGTEISKTKRGEINVQEHPAEGYWKTTNDRHPFISLRCAYFSSDPDSVPNGYYYLGNHGKDDDFIGRPEVDNVLSVIKLTKADTVLDTIIEHSIKNAEQEVKFFYAKLDNVYTKNRDKDIKKFGENSLIIDDSNKRNDVVAPDETTLVRDINPFRLSERTFAALADLQDRLTRYIDKNNYPLTVVNDVTSVFYDVTTKIVKNVKNTTKVLHKEFIVGYRSKKLKIQHHKGEVDVILTFGIDILDRNALKRLEEFDPSVKIITWLESDNCVKYATIIETANGDCGIWCGYYSNKIFVE